MKLDQIKAWAGRKRRAFWRNVAAGLAVVVASLASAQQCALQKATCTEGPDTITYNGQPLDC